MTAVVRIFYHQGLMTAPISNSGGRFSSDSVQMLHQPYQGSDSLTCDTGTIASTNGQNAGAGALLARVEVQPGHAVYCEINPPNRSVNANTGSPMISGNVVYPFGQGWKISVLEAALS
jgi:hypothetical protein